MTSLPSGLASISARLDDSPQVRGAVAFGRMVGEREEAAKAMLGVTSIEWGHMFASCDLGPAIDRHAALAVSAGYRGRDRR